jgi:2',3'-cyclic-nucleotide 2'-phosphodiesterase (5'-nucleotidase family)
VSKAKIAILSWVALLCMTAAGAQSALGQAAARATSAPPPANIHTTVTETSVDSSLPDDPRVDNMLKVYSPKVLALDEVIGKLNGDLKKGAIGAGSLGNFVADWIRLEASRKLGKPIVLAVTNAGGLRKSAIPEGDLRLRDIFELLPFENALIAFDLTGAQVLDLLRVNLSHRDAQSGAQIKYQINSNRQPGLDSARLLTDGVEKEIDPAATYTVISIDYLLNVSGGDYAKVMKQAKNTLLLGLTIRDAMTNYVKRETAAGREIKSTLDGRFVLDKAASAAAEEPKP